MTQAPERPEPATQAELFELLDELGIAHRTVRHPPLHTVEESNAWRAGRTDMAGGHCKNLFLKDRDGRLFLVVMLEETAVRLNRLHKALGCARLSFGKPDLLRDALGVEPGSVTPFALINDRANRVRVVLDKAMLAHDPVHFHPLKNDATTALSPDDLVRFVRASGHEPLVFDFGGLDAAHGGPE